MESVILEIVSELRAAAEEVAAAGEAAIAPASAPASAPLASKRLEQIIRAHNKGLPPDARPVAKKRLLPFYLRVKEQEPERWASWGIGGWTEQQLIATLQVKARRTASGVATITVLSKPWPCQGDCLYCPRDLRMPRSYLADEPACQRAERNYFDPYLQVASRLRALTQMGHVTDKIELIILGGSWVDYPPSYQTWFVSELFRALNDDAGREADVSTRRRFYVDKGLSNNRNELAARVRQAQSQVDGGSLSYNQAIRRLYQEDPAWCEVAEFQQLDADQPTAFEKLAEQQQQNEGASHRVVGLSVELRPDNIDAAALIHLRRLGCTKVQIGIQSTDQQILQQNERGIDPPRIAEAFLLLRAFGFKIHAHFMLNLLGSSVQRDIDDYLRLVTDPAYLPDEVKLYPCALVPGTRLVGRFADGSWQPYSEQQLVDVLSADTLNTPPFVRISRMIRDISADDILVGNKKANLRQLVEAGIEAAGGEIQEIRYREVGRQATDIESLRLEICGYDTSLGEERFLQWVTPANRIAGYLRLSLPDPGVVSSLLPALPTLSAELGQAMVRELHVYGQVARLSQVGEGIQHLGLGRQLIEAAAQIARQRGYACLNVISSVGTRQYYRNLGFLDNGLYQQLSLD